MLNHIQHRRHGDYISARSSDVSGPDIRTVPWIIVNTVLAGLLILLAPSPAISLLVGGSAIAVAAFTGANIARRRVAATTSPTPLDVLTAWLPGFVALALAISGLALVLQNPGHELLRLGGIGLFLVQILFIAVLGATTERVTAPAGRSSSRHSG